jgi:hypothetical protein
MPETILTPSSIKLYGRIVSGLQYADDTAASDSFGNNGFLKQQLAGAPSAGLNFTGNTAASGRVITITTAPSGTLTYGMLLTGFTAPTISGAGTITTPSAPILPPGAFINTLPSTTSPQTITSSAIPLVLGSTGCSFTAWSPTVNVARIYAFSFEGSIYSLPKPSMFFVHTTGASVDITQSVGRSSTQVSGVVAREWEFAAQVAAGYADLRYWEYEKGDFSIRLDTEAGQLEQILLAAALRAGADMADRATGIRSGASLAGASLSGASLSGASLSGASLSGASLSGASLSGASLRGR